MTSPDFIHEPACNARCFGDFHWLEVDTSPAPVLGIPALRWSNLDRLIAAVESLEHIAEAASDTQAARVDPVNRAWFEGYRQCAKDVLDAHELYRLAYPERKTP